MSCMASPSLSDSKDGFRLVAVANDIRRADLTMEGEQTRLQGPLLV